MGLGLSPLCSTAGDYPHPGGSWAAAFRTAGLRPAALSARQVSPRPAAPPSRLRAFQRPSRSYTGLLDCSTSADSTKSEVFQKAKPEVCSSAASRRARSSTSSSGSAHIPAVPASRTRFSASGSRSNTTARLAGISGTARSSRQSTRWSPNESAASRLSSKWCWNLAFAADDRPYAARLTGTTISSRIAPRLGTGNCRVARTSDGREGRLQPAMFCAYTRKEQPSGHWSCASNEVRSVFSSKTCQPFLLELAARRYSSRHDSDSCSTHCWLGPGLQAT
eukprot:scaffold125911_cov63-Phaeocystis_antarctica.AAC.2